MSRYRNWMVTDFCHFVSHYQNICLNQTDPLITAICCQVELCPLSGREHLQVYIECQRAVPLKKLKDHVQCQTIHAEARRGTQAQALTYCTKIESRKLDQSPFIWGKFKEQGKRTDLETIVDEVKAKKTTREIIENNPEALRYINHIEKFSYLVNWVKRDWVPIVTVLIGHPGCGKTRYVYEQEKIEELYIVPEPTSTVWFDGYKGQEAVLFDDFSGNIRYHLMLQLLDRYPMTVNVKGGHTNWAPRRIYITSNLQVHEWYPNKNVDALRRRISEVQYRCTEVAGNTIPPQKYTLNEQI